MRVRDPKNGFAAVVAPGSAWWTSIEKPDKYTIILTSDKPRPGVYDFLNYLRIQDKDVRDGPDGATKVGGTGPLKWVEWVPGDHITMVKNPNYWDSGQPFLDEYKVTDLPRPAGDGRRAGGRQPGRGRAGARSLTPCA